jgi:molybdopterin/thiamine biosynthesis adenylyltransferase/rhodanese-related sulfurtransferase
MSLEPLVDPADNLTSAEREHYARHITLDQMGATGQRRLKNARVLVIGAGGLGSPALLYLAAAGVGTLGIVDDDIVERSNLQRQVIHGVNDVGHSKTASARDAIIALNPLVRVHLHNTRLTSTNVCELFAHYDLIVDGSDNFATRYLVNDAAAILGKPYVWGSLNNFSGQVSIFWQKHGPTYRDLYPESPLPETVVSCDNSGVLGTLCATIGSLMGTETIKLITGIGHTLLGRVLLINALTPSWQEITIAIDPQRKPITELASTELIDTGLVDTESFCGPTPHHHVPGMQHIVTAPELGILLTQRECGLKNFDVIDVREQHEYETTKIPGALLVPLGQILSGTTPPELSRDRDAILYCAVGARSATALAELHRRGFTRVKHLHGGLRAWQAKE